MANERSGDLILSQQTFVLIQDGATGQVQVAVGPHKESLAETDKPVIYRRREAIFEPADKNVAIQTFPTAHEGQYIILTNPEAGNSHPSKGKSAAPALQHGHKINIPGPATFALYPGQTSEVVDGHQLRSNEYLLVRVYNEVAAKENFAKAVIKLNADDNDPKAKKQNSSSIQPENLITGNLLVIKGTDVSFYIPPTGIEVLKDENGKFIRDAITLERLEYCILLDQNGDKRFVKGPAVVFPKPTETFVESGSSRKFRATDLNENMGLYIKIIADYSENGKDYKEGDEIFITGKEQKIYYPRPEHAVIKYGNKSRHYAVAIPEGEGRYVLDKETGKIDLIKGPEMYLPDPRRYVIVKRILDEKTIDLWFPGNEEAKVFNKRLAKLQEVESDIAYDDKNRYMNKSVLNQEYLSADTFAGEEVQRKSKFTEPRTITLETKYDGAVRVDVWPGFAVQIVKKSGDRKLVVGPKTILLDYDEELEILELSTGTPKNDQRTKKTVYLQTVNNKVSDRIEAETSDYVPVSVLVSYRVNFEDTPEKWFAVPNYVKLLTEHMRSMIRSEIKKSTLEEFYSKSTGIIRDLILGVASTEEKKVTPRPGRKFVENGMRIYDVEVLDVTISDEEMEDLIKATSQSVIRYDMQILGKQKEVAFVEATEGLTRTQLEESNKTQELRRSFQEADKVFNEKLKDIVITADKNRQNTVKEIADSETARKRQTLELEHEFIAKNTDVEIKETQEKLKAIQPQLVEAILSLATVSQSEILAKNLKSQHGGLMGLITGGGGFEELLSTIKGTPLYDAIENLKRSYDAQKKAR